jgi:hypothetical protein
VWLQFDPPFQVEEFHVEEFHVDEKFQVDEFQVDEFHVEEFHVDEFQVEEFQVEESHEDATVVPDRHVPFGRHTSAGTPWFAAPSGDETLTSEPIARVVRPPAWTERARQISVYLI